MNHIIMIKKILYRFLPVCLLVAGFSGCKDDTMEPLPETVPLIVEANAKSFVMGEKLILTVKVNDTKNPDRVSNEDFDIYLTAKDGEKSASQSESSRHVYREAIMTDGILVENIIQEINRLAETGTSDLGAVIFSCENA